MNTGLLPPLYFVANSTCKNCIDSEFIALDSKSGEKISEVDNPAIPDFNRLDINIPKIFEDFLLVTEVDMEPVNGLTVEAAKLVRYGILH